MLFKITGNLLLSNVLFKIKYTFLNGFIIWVFGPLGVIKIKLKATSILNFFNLNVLYFDEVLVNTLKNKVGYLTSVGDYIRNSVVSVCKGYSCYIRIKGVGYKIEQKGSDNLIVTIGYSHKVIIKLPVFIKIHILKKRIILWSYSLVKLQWFCCMLYSLKKKDPYTGKGIIQPHLQKKLKVGKISRV